MVLHVSRLATVRAIVLAKHSPKRNVGADELVVRLYLSLVDRPIALAPKIVGLAIDQTIVDIHSGLFWFIGKENRSKSTENVQHKIIVVQRRTPSVPK